MSENYRDLLRDKNYEIQNLHDKIERKDILIRTLIREKRREREKFEHEIKGLKKKYETNRKIQKGIWSSKVEKCHEIIKNLGGSLPRSSVGRETRVLDRRGSTSKVENIEKYEENQGDQKRGGRVRFEAGSAKNSGLKSILKRTGSSEVSYFPDNQTDRKKFRPDTGDLGNDFLHLGLFSKRL